MAKIVVTGFEGWGDNLENPTLLVLDELKRSPGVPGDLTTVPLPVDSAALAAITSRTLDEIRPDVWISLGLAAGSAVIAVERIAANVMDFPYPDNAGVQHGGEPVFAGAPAGYMATIPVKAIAQDLRASGVPAKLSNSPSTFLCNQMMYTVLHLVAKKAMSTRAGFIHVPAHPALAARQVDPRAEMPSMSVGLMTAAVKKAIDTTLAVADDRHEPTFNS